MSAAEIIIGILNKTALRIDPPKMFGAFHILAVLVVTITACVCALASRKLTDTARCRLLFLCGVILLIMEGYKQLFLYFIVNGQAFDWWFFPFQLCSVPMYLCLLLPLTGKDSRPDKSIVTFIAGYAFVGAVAALIWPEDFLRSYLSLTLHGFIWHGILLFISLTVCLSGMADVSPRGQFRAAALFVLLSGIAVIINIIAEPRMAAGSLPHRYSAMFYLNPLHYSDQPVVSTVQHAAGIPAGMILYMCAIILAAWISSSLLSRQADRRQH